MADTLCFLPLLEAHTIEYFLEALHSYPIPHDIVTIISLGQLCDLISTLFIDDMCCESGVELCLIDPLYH